MKRLSTTLGETMLKTAAMEGNGQLENSELVIWTENSNISLCGKEIIDLYFLIKKGLDRRIIKSFDE